MYIIADSFKNKTIEQLEKLPCKCFTRLLLPIVQKPNHLTSALKIFSHDYDIALICDADNMLAKGFLKKINDAFMNGAKAIQGRRVAKNLDTSFAILDSCSEAINNNIFRKGANALGISSSVIGSGMAFEFDTLKAALLKYQIQTQCPSQLMKKINPTHWCLSKNIIIYCFAAAI